MVEHERLARMTIDQADRLRQLSLAEEEIVGKIAAGELSDAAVKGGLIEVAVRLPLDDLAQADQFAVTGKGLKR